MNFDELIIDRPLRAHKYNFDGKRIWTQSNLKDFKLTLGGETVYATDELGTNIMGFDRSKTASAEWSNALLHLGTLADQMGTDKQVAAGSGKELEVTRVFFLTTDDGEKLTLPHTPVNIAESTPFKYIDKVDNRNVTLETYELGSTPATNFSVTGTEVTLPTGKCKKGDKFAVKMTYKTESGMAIDDSANKFSEEGVFVIEALCYNPCDKGTKILTNIIFPSAKEDASVEVDFNNELTHPITINATQEYCSEDKRLVRIEVVEE